jgi:alpha-galactosidase
MAMAILIPCAGGVPAQGVAVTNSPPLKALEEVAETPPIIVNTFYEWPLEWRTSVNETNVAALLREISTNLVPACVAAGTKPFLWIDDGYQATNRVAGTALGYNTNFFPDGLAALVNWIHASNCLAGVYTSFGTRSCLGLPGTTEADVFNDVVCWAGMGFDGLKVDDCTACWDGVPGSLDSYTLTKLNLFASAIQISGRPMVLDCNSPESPVERHTPIVANIWQQNSGVAPSADIVPGIDNLTLTSNVCLLAGTVDARLITKGHYPRWGAVFYPQGSGGVQAYLIMSAMVPSPIQMSGWSSGQWAVVSNVDLLSIHQDAAVLPGSMLSSNNSSEVWVRPLHDVGSGMSAVAFFNFSSAATNLGVAWSQLGLSSTAAATVYDCIHHTNAGTFSGGFTNPISGASSQLFSITQPPPLMITAWLQTNGVIAFAWNATTGRTYQVQYLTDPAQSNWHHLTSVVAGDITACATDVIGPDPQRFYRVVLLP